MSGIYGWRVYHSSRGMLDANVHGDDAACVPQYTYDLFRLKILFSIARVSRTISTPSPVGHCGKTIIAEDPSAG